MDTSHSSAQVAKMAVIFSRETDTSTEERGSQEGGYLYELNEMHSTQLTTEYCILLSSTQSRKYGHEVRSKRSKIEAYLAMGLGGGFGR